MSDCRNVAIKEVFEWGVLNPVSALHGFFWDLLPSSIYSYWRTHGKMRLREGLD